MPSVERSTDVLIVGGGTGSVAAALAIARSGGRCMIVEPTDWIGGQLTSQAVPPDENRWIEGADGVQSAARSYLDFRGAVRRWYRDHTSLTPAARSDPHPNPGNGWVSHLCFEPKVGHDILQSMLAEHVAMDRIAVLYQAEPVSAEVEGDRIRSVTFWQGDDRIDIHARYILDATECGDLLALANVESVIGAEGRNVHGELHAPADSNPMDQQAISWCFAIDHRPGEDHRIEKPARYEFWRDYVPPLDIPWPGKLFSWTVVGGDEHKPRTFRFLPPPMQPDAGEWDMWRYRRIVDGSLFDPPARDVSLINMVQMDYFQRPTLGVSADDRRRAFDEAREQSLCFLYWMQEQLPGLALRGDVLGTADGFAKHPYIREARRLIARTIVTEAHVGVEQRRQENRPNGAEPFADSIGIGHYRLDLHPSTAMRASIYVEAAPFRIPMGALIPIRIRNLLAAGKCLGVTHVTNGCYRLHPVEWNVGESAGLLALHCLQSGLEPQQIHEHIDQVRGFQSILQSQGIPLAWPW